MAKSGLERDVTIIGSDVIQPVDIQSHYQQTVQTHNAVSLTTQAWSMSSSAIDTDGFDTISVGIKTSGANTSVSVYWSYDGTDFSIRQDLAFEYVAVNTAKVTVSVPTKARYCKINILNNDAATQTLSAWAYLKA